MHLVYNRLYITELTLTFLEESYINPFTGGETQYVLTKCMTDGFQISNIRMIDTIIKKLTSNVSQQLVLILLIRTNSIDKIVQSRIAISLHTAAKGCHVNHQIRLYDNHINADTLSFVIKLALETI